MPDKAQDPRETKAPLSPAPPSAPPPPTAPPPPPPSSSSATTRPGGAQRTFILPEVASGTASPSSVPTTSSAELDPFKVSVEQLSSGKVPPTSLLEKVTSKGDSKGSRYLADPRFYSLCHFENVCIASSTKAFTMVVDSEEEREYYTSQLAFCEERSSRRLPLCGCFTKQLEPVFVTAQSVAGLARKPGHWWISDKCVLGHQISHWA